MMRIKAVFLFLFLFIALSHSQNDIDVVECSKEQFLLNNIKNENLSNAYRLFFSEKPEEAYLDLKKFQEELDKKYKPFALLLEADILYQTGSYSKSLGVYNEILVLKVVPADIKFYALINVGNIQFHSKKKYEASIKYYKQAQILLAGSKCQEKKLLVYEGLGNSYLFTKNFSKSEISYTTALTIYKGKKDAKNIARTYSNLANLFYEQYLDAKAEAYFLKALDAVKNTPFIKVKQNVYYNLYAVNKGLGKYKEALQYLSKSNALKDSIWNRDKVWELAEKDKEISIAIKDKELLVQKEIGEKQKLRLQWGGGILALVLLFLGTLFYSYKTKVKQNKIITNQKGELEKLNHAKNYLFSVISHDLRSPVKTLIKQQQRFIKKIKEENLSSLQETAGSTLSIVEGLNHLLNNVLHWSLEQNDQLIFDQKVQALYPVIHQVVFDFELLAGEKNIIIETSLNEETFINVDRESLKVVLRNLLDNAIKYTPDGGTIKVSSFEENDSCHIEIQDSGIGISEEQLERINSLKELSIDKINRSKGIGLGLLLCTTLTKKNDGIFHVTSQLDHGTVMKITFPAIKNVT